MYEKKYSKGKTFTNVDSLKIETKVSDDFLLEPETAHAVIPDTKITQHSHIPAKRKTFARGAVHGWHGTGYGELVR